MKNFRKDNSGITLIALVVTIVVLLILAGITISTLFGENGIISAARKAADDTANAENTTNKGLQDLQDQMTDKLSDGKWKDNGNGTFTCGSKTVTIGDYVTYDPGSHTHTPDTTKGAGTSASGNGGSTPYTLTASQLTTQSNFKSWRVLGVNDKGQLELISSDPTSQTLYLANDTGYLNAEDNLNKYCDDLYGKGTNASGARSLNVDDIDKLSKYDKTTYGSGTSKYGTKWQYQFPSSGSQLQYRTKGTATNASWSNWSNISFTDDSYQKFRMPGSTEVINSSNPKEGPELEHTYYNYNIASNITTADGYTSELATTIGNMITNGTGTSNINQWLASRCVYCYSYCATFRVRLVISGNVNNDSLFSSNGNYNYNNCRVRPVVSLASGVNLAGTGKNLGTVSNPYILSK